MKIEADMGGAPDSEFCPEFIQGMMKRMAMSYYKYGLVADGYPEKVDAIESAEIRIRRYIGTGNSEYLMDAANFLMIEFMRPRHPSAHFEPRDAKDSPGRKWVGEVDPHQERNRLERMR